MNLFSCLFLLFFNLFSIFSLNEQLIIDNPIQSNKTYNPIYYKIIILSETIVVDYPKISSFSSNSVLLSNTGIESQQYTFTVFQHYEKLYYNSFVLFPDFFAFNDNSNNKYFIIENKLYQMNDIYSFKFILNFNFSCIDFIKGNRIKYGQQESSFIDNEILIYGKQNENIYFYSIDSNILIYTDLKNIDNTYISCKLLLKQYFICIYSQNNQIKMSILNKTNTQNITTIHTFNESSNIFFSEINEPILYDTNKEDFKIICGRKNDNIGDIKCILVNIIFFADNNLKFEIDLYNIISINTTFSSNENNCNYTMFESEYLICCGNIGAIICERRDMNLKFIDSFNLVLGGNIKNLTIENNNNTYIKLLYFNNTSESKNIYEYHIYPPKCSNKTIKLSKQRSFKIDLDNLFERKTNTNYYIQTISKDNVIIKINEYILNNLGEKILLKSNQNLFYYDFQILEEIKNFDILYHISIEETYSDLCSISFIFNSCYYSCAECSLSEKDSNITSHNCIKCKNNYYTFPKGSSNCFNKKEMDNKNISYFFDNETNTFAECNSECQTCNGPNKNNCLSCRNETLLIYKGECLVECPNGTFLIKNSKGHQECKNF